MGTYCCGDSTLVVRQNIAKISRVSFPEVNKPSVKHKNIYITAEEYHWCDHISDFLQCLPFYYKKQTLENIIHKVNKHVKNNCGLCLIVYTADSV